MTKPGSRLAPLEPAHWDERTRQLLGSSVGPVGRPLNILGTLAHHPRLLEPFLGFAATLAARGTLPRRASELLALRAAWNCRSPFEWGHHVLYGRAAGLSDQEIQSIAAGPDAGSWSEEDRELLVAADELHRSQDLSDASWGRLRDRWDEAQLIEIAFVVGHYTMLSMVTNATGVPLEPGLPGMPDGALPPG